MPRRQPPQFPELDLSGLPPDPDEMDLSGMPPDLDMSGLPPDMPEAAPMPDIPPLQIPPAQAQMPSAPEPPPQGAEGYWAKFRSPLSNYGTRMGEQVQQTDTVSPFHDEEGAAYANMGKDVAQFAGQTFDAMSSPLNLATSIATGSANMLKSPVLGLLGKGLSAATSASGVQNMAESDTWMGKATGAIEALGGALGMKAPPKLPTLAGKVDEVVPPVAGTPPLMPGAPPIDLPLNPAAGVDTALAAGADEFGVIPPTRPPAAEAVAAAAPLPNPILPPDLAGAKPRANLGGKIFIPQFESDIDKALYIVAQATPSKRNEDYMQFLIKSTGLDRDALMKLALQQKQQIKAAMSGSQVTGDIQIPRMWTPESQLGAAAPTAEAIAEQFPPGLPTAKAADKINDYSPASEMAARKVFADNGVEIPPDMTNKQIIEGARALRGETEAIPAPTGQKVVTPPPEVAKPGVPKPKVKINTDGTWTPEEYPDLKVNKDGKIVGTHSGQPVGGVAPEVERQLLLEVANAPKALISSMDFSFPFRQGLTLWHKKAWRDAWMPMFKSFGSQKTFDSLIDEINSRPNALAEMKVVNGKAVKSPSVYERAGLAITNDTTQRELEHMGKLTDWLPHVGSSNRAFTAFANKLRSDTFDSLIKDFQKAGIDATKDDAMLKALGDFVNEASGRGSLNYDLGKVGGIDLGKHNLEKSASLLNALFFSPRLTDARIKMFGKSAMAGANAIMDPRQFVMSGPSVRKEYLKSMLALGTAWSTISGLAYMAGANVTMDTTSSDFAKPRFGNTRLDPGGGFQQFIVLASRLAQQETTSSIDDPPKTTEFGGKGPFARTMASTVKNFGYNKSSPTMRAIIDFASQQEGNEFDMPEQVGRLTLPIIVQDLLEIVNDPSVNSNAEIAALGPAVFGVGGQTYGRENINRRMLGDFGKDLTFPRKNRY